MFNKIEFSDLYKFLTSVGLIFVASAFLIPWLFMNQGNGLNISAEEYNKLVTDSKLLADKRIELNIIVIKIIPYISAILFSLGSTIIIYGILKWKKKQNIVDTTESLKLTQLQFEIQNLKPAEIQQKAQNEIEQEIKIESKSEPGNVAQEIIKTPNEIEELKTNLIDMENLFFQKIKDYNSFIFEPRANVKIADKYEVDIVLNAYNPRSHKDTLIEIKYFQNKLSMQLVRDAYTKLQNISNHYNERTKRISRTLLIIVYKENIAEKEEINRFTTAIEDFKKEISNPYFRILVMTDSAAKTYDIKDIVK